MISSKLTPKQNQDLSLAGITSLYQLITYMPYDIVRLEYLDFGLSPEALQVTSATVQDYTIMSGKRPFTKIILNTPSGTIGCYSFVPYRFLYRQLSTLEPQYWTLKHRGEFWTIERITKTDPLAGLDTGTVLPKYHPLGTITSKSLQTIHDRLSAEDYILNFSGIIPLELIGNQALSLYSLHHTSQQNRYEQTLSQWKLIQAFLKLMELRYFGEQVRIGHAKPSFITTNSIAQVIDCHPYKLSVTQDSAIRTLLKKLSA